MKQKWLWNLLLALVATFCFAGCSEEQVDLYDPDVKLFVKQLKSGTYNTKNMAGIVQVPEFSPKHIPQLLSYMDDMTEIPSFPLPTISSQYGGRARLGECMLWIVEAIRLGYPPSLGCKLVYKDAEDYEGIYFLTNSEVQEVVSLYRDWWEKVEKANPIEAMYLWEIEPLAHSNYRWW